MRILYGVQGTGNGHITRARVMLPALLAQGCSVDFVFSGRDKNAYFDMDMFGDYRTYKGFSLVSQAGTVNWFKTLTQAAPVRFIRDGFSLNVKDYDLVLTDFEPISAWAAKRQGVPSVGLAHQYALCYRIPGTEKAPLLSPALKAFAPADYYLGVHWAHYDYPIIPPLISMNHEQPTQELDFVLVYLPFEETQDVIAWLKQIPGQRFIVYDKRDTASEEDNVLIKPLSRTTFPIDLANCSGVICNTGFGLCSEAMVLGKKILTKALAKQIEQVSNGQILEELNRAVVFHRFDVYQLSNWLRLPMPPRAVFPNVADEVAKWLVQGQYHDRQGLIDRLWQQSAHVDIENDVQLMRPPLEVRRAHPTA